MEITFSRPAGNEDGSGSPASRAVCPAPPMLDRKWKELYVTVRAMPLRSEVSSRDTLNTISPLTTSLTATEERRRTGRYVAGGTALAVTLLALHHALLRGASTMAGVCIPAIIMASYILWVLYSARRDRRKALRIATALQLTEVINVPPAVTSDAVSTEGRSNAAFKNSPTLDDRQKFNNANRPRIL